MKFTDNSFANGHDMLESPFTVRSTTLSNMGIFKLLRWVTSCEHYVPYQISNICFSKPEIHFASIFYGQESF